MLILYHHSFPASICKDTSSFLLMLLLYLTKLDTVCIILMWTTHTIVAIEFTLEGRLVVLVCINTSNSTCTMMEPSNDVLPGVYVHCQAMESYIFWCFWCQLLWRYINSQMLIDFSNSVVDFRFYYIVLTHSTHIIWLSSS